VRELSDQGVDHDAHSRIPVPGQALHEQLNVMATGD
jgi:hypothetical protein